VCEDALTKLLALSGKLIVQVKPAAVKQPDKKDNQGHADTAFGSVPVIALIACPKLSESTAGQKPMLTRAARRQIRQILY
jgi:hypothetical protein